MFAWIAPVIQFGVWLWNLLKPKQTPEEKLGIAETEAKNAEVGLAEVQGAVDAANRERAADAGRVLTGSSPASAPYKPGAD